MWVWAIHRPLWMVRHVTGRGSLRQNAYMRLREYSVHLYSVTSWSPSARAAITIKNTTLNHDATAEPNQARAAYAAAQGVESVIRAGSCVSCSGKPAVLESYSAV